LIHVDPQDAAEKILRDPSRVVSTVVLRPSSPTDM
jgi:hypothetical protein